MLPLVNLYRQKINTTFYIFLSLACSAFRYFSHVLPHMLSVFISFILKCISIAFLQFRFPCLAKVSLSLSLCLYVFHLPFSAPHSPDIDQGQMIMSKLVTFIRCVMKEYILPSQQFGLQHTHICSAWHAFSLRWLFLARIPPHPPTYTNSQSTFTAGPAVAPLGGVTFDLEFKGLGPSPPGCKISEGWASYICLVLTQLSHTHMHTSCLRLCILRWFRVYRLNRDTYGSLRLWACFMFQPCR